MPDLTIGFSPEATKLLQDLANGRPAPEVDLMPWSIFAPHVQQEQEAWLDKSNQIMWVKAGQKPVAPGFRQLFLGSEMTR